MGKVRCQIFDKDGQRFVEEIHKVTVHQFSMGDVDDPDLYAAGPLWEWKESEEGKFIMEHAIDKPEWHRQTDVYQYGYQYAIVAELEKKKLTEYYLKFGPFVK